jgi:hypothetical protein
VSQTGERILSKEVRELKGFMFNWEAAQLDSQVLLVVNRGNIRISHRHCCNLRDPLRKTFPLFVVVDDNSCKAANGK